MRFIITFLLLISGTASASDEQLKITKLADNLYQHISYKNIKPWGMVGASGLIVVDGKNAHIIDTPWTQEETEKLINWIRSKGLIAKSSIVTHFHEDASGGIPFLNKSKIKTYATSQTNNLLNLKHREQSSNEIPSTTFELVKGTIEIYYPGPGHTEDNIVVWLPKSNILFGGCFVKSMNSKNLGNTEDASINKWPASIQKVINKYPNIEIVVPGHGKVGDINLLKHTAKLALGVASNKLLKQGS
ncbi:subclass B1 metallo-beta-lactamase [Thalassotalea psychrophila]|uniref:beta-lactamase n=1 Tax=Thalassotalea psychrophila TaxID=3065647 RepID=A0ABY9TU59_9GAMM|nr:subclass B1 metallo-beta-lactamase [Colwelliaceae bacterium SQ149]